MTPVDIEKLKERLRRTKTEHRVLHLFGGAISVPDEDETREVPVNPDGEEAADLIEALIAKAERVDALEAVLREIAKPGCGAGNDWGDDERADYWSNQAIRCRSLARNALSPKPEISDPTKRMEKILGAKFARRDNALSPKESE